MTRFALVLLISAFVPLSPADAGSDPGARPAIATDAVIAGATGEIHWLSRGGKPFSPTPEILDDLHAGDRLRLAPGSSLVMIYYQGCRKETVTGAGEVTIGPSTSEVKAPATLASQHIQCEPPRLASSTKVGSVPGALVLMGAGKRPDPEAEFREAIDRNPKDVPALMAYAQFLENRGRYGDAERHFEAIARLEPDSASVRTQRDTLKAAASYQGLQARMKDHPADALNADTLRDAGITEPELLKTLPGILMKPAGAERQAALLTALASAYHADPDALERLLAR